MGLETATYLSQLDSSNPLAGDRKNQGDDHLRLLKATLQNTFPGIVRAVRFPDLSVLSADTTLDATYDGKLVAVQTATGAKTITLPTPTFNGWRVQITKSTTDNNPVYVLPPSGTISVAVGNVAKVRLAVPSEVQEFYWTGAFFRPSVMGAPRPGAIELSFGALSAGYGLINGASLLQADYPELFSVLGVTFGSVDGAHFSLPNLLDRFPVFAGNTYAIGATGGEATHILLSTEMPLHTHAPTLIQSPHDHGILGGVTGASSVGNPPAGSNSPFGAGAALDVQPANADISITIGNAGGGLAHENRPPYYGIYPVFRMC